MNSIRSAFGCVRFAGTVADRNEQEDDMADPSRGDPRCLDMWAEAAMIAGVQEK